MVSRQEARDSQRPRLLAALMSLVARHGYPDVTVAMLAAEAHVSLSTFYAHFADKEECLLAAYDDVADELLDVVASAGDREDWQDSVRSGVEAYVRWFVARPEAAATFVVDIHTAGRTALRRRQEVLERFRALLRHRGCETRAAAALVATLDAAVHERLVTGDLDALIGEIPALGQLAVALVGTTTTA